VRKDVGTGGLSREEKRVSKVVSTEKTKNVSKDTGIKKKSP